MTRFDKLFQAKRSLESATPEPDATELEQPTIEPPVELPASVSLPSEPVQPPTPEPTKPVEGLSKSKDPNYVRTTVYLPKRLHHRLKVAALDDSRDMSEIVGDLVEEWLDGNPSNI